MSKKLRIMDRLWYLLTDYIYRQFKALWILITIVVFLLCSVVTWYNTINNIHSAFFNQPWYNQILLGIDILVISSCLYCLVKNFLQKHHSLQWSIRKAIKREQFYPVYQPVFNEKLTIPVPKSF